MIIYGWKAKQIYKETLHDDCQHCHSRGAVDIFVFQKYAHVFWLPFFPLGKTGVSQCGHCKQTLQLKEMPAKYRDAYNGIKKNARIPLYMFAGLILVGGLIIYGVITDRQKNKRVTSSVEMPLRPDI